jgi:proteic killer suppression protein
VIRSFADADTELLWLTGKSRRIPASIRKTALKRLFILRRALHLNDLKAPPGNRLERLTGDRKGQHSIRINDQFRLCFRWSEGDACEVEIVDYH